MNNIICHFSPSGGLDDRMSKLTDVGYTKEQFATLRGLYDMAHRDNPLISDEVNDKDLDNFEVLKLGHKLLEYENNLAMEHIAEMKNSVKHMAEVFRKLYAVPGWDAATRRNRTNMIITEFTNEVNRRVARAQENGIPVTREEVVNGYKSNGKHYDGQGSIFEAVFDRLLKKFNAAREEIARFEGYSTEDLKTISNGMVEDIKAEYNQAIGIETDQRKIDELREDAEKQIAEVRHYFDVKLPGCLKIVEEYPKIFQNWASLCTYARIGLRNSESLKLGLTIEYAAPTSPDNYSLDEAEEYYVDMEETVRESWQNRHDTVSVFSSMGAEIRRFISTIQDVDDTGKKMTDDLGYPIMMDPIRTHGYLSDLLRGTTTETSMLHKLRTRANESYKTKAIFEALAQAVTGSKNGDFNDSSQLKNPVLVTQLLVDMHRNMVPFSALLKSKAGNIYAKILNRKANPLHDEFILRMAAHQQLDTQTSVYDESGNINWKNLIEWYREADYYIPAAEEGEKKKNVFDTSNTLTSSFIDRFTPAQRVGFLMRASNALGIKMTETAASRIVSKRSLLDTYLKALQEFGKVTFDSLSLNIKKDIVKAQEKSSDEEYNEALDALNNIKYPYQQLLDFKKNTDTESNGYGNDRIARALDVVVEVTDNLEIERRVPWYDKKGKPNSRYSDVTPSYMGDFVDKLHEFIEERDKEGLQTFIEEKWGTSTFFVKDKSGGHGNYVFYNRWLQELYNSIYKDTSGRIVVNSDALAKVFAFDNFLGSNINRNVVIFENFTEKQHAEAMMKQFLQPFDQSKNSKLAKYPCFILGDSGVQMFFTAKRYKKNFIKNGLYDIYAQELERVKYVDASNNILLKEFANNYGYDFKEENGKVKVFNSQGRELSNKELKGLGYRPIENFTNTANEFTMLKFLNYDFADGKYWKILAGKENMTPEQIKALSKEEAFEMVRYAAGTTALEKAIETYMTDAVAEFKKKLAKVGILREIKDKEGNVIYDDKNNYFEKNLSLYRIDGKTDGKELDRLIEDFYWNTKYATIEQLQIFTVDPAFYDYRYPVKDLQKRYKEIYAPGKGVSIEAKDYKGKLFTNRDYERAVYFDDVAVSSEDVNPDFAKMLIRNFKKADISAAEVEDAINNMDIVTPRQNAAEEAQRQAQLKNILGNNYKRYKAYMKNTLTDGQGYRTIESYRVVMGMSGQWTRAMDNAYNKIMAIRERVRNGGEPLNQSDIEEISEASVILQPIKPYLYTLEKMQINDEGDTVLVPVQHKYAEIVLIPELMQEGKLKNIALWMENNDIDLVASTKCVKVGAFGSVDLKNIGEGNELNDVLNKAYIHNLSWADYRIQSGVPEHLNHAQLFGTQIRKLMLSNINKDKDYDYLGKIFGIKTDDPRGPKVYIPGMGNVYLNGRNLISLYNCLIMANIFDSYEQFSENSSTTKSLSDRAVQNVISNSNQSADNAFGFSLIEDGENAGEFTIPPAEPGMEHDAIGLFLSLLTKQVNKQKIKGGSAVQASAMGISGIEDSGNLFEVVDPNGDNVLYDEMEMPFNLSYTTSKGNSVPLKYSDWCYTTVTDDEYGHHEIGDLKLSGQIVYGEDAREYLSWPVSGRDKYGKAIDPSQGYYIPLIETKYKGILDIIAYRIPTEKEYSIINGKVIRFSDPFAGGTLKLPSSRTTTAGFDFDIDKLYFFMRDYVQKELTRPQRYKIWKAIYQENPKFAAALRQAAQNDAKGKKVLDELFKESPREGAQELIDANDFLEGDFYKFWDAAMEVAAEYAPANTAPEAFNKYLENHRKEYPVFEEYDLTLSPLNPSGDNGGNTRAARNNLLIDLIRQRLMDKETLQSRYTPGGFDTNREAALRQRVLQFAPINDITDGHGNIDWNKVDKYVERINDDTDPTKDPEPEYDVSDPTAILVYNQQNQIADKLIGIFANQNTNHAYSSILNALKLNFPIKFGNHTDTGLNDMLKAPEGVDVDINVAEYLAASVDAVKDPVLNFLNLNLVTADAGALLARIGYTPMEIGLLFNQPIIKELCDYVANEGVSTDIAISQMLRNYGNNRMAIKDIKFDSNKVSTDKLASYILEQRKIDEGSIDKSEAFKQNQLNVLWLFNELMADTADVTTFIQATRFTAGNAIGSSWGDIFAQEERIKAFVDKYTKDDNESGKSAEEEEESAKDKKRLYFELFAKDEVLREGSIPLKDAKHEKTQGILDIDEDILDLTPEQYMKLMARNPFAFEQCMMDMTRKATRKIFSKYFPYYTKLYTDMRNTVGNLTKYGTLDAETINSLHRDFMVYLLSQNKGSKFDGEAESGYVDSRGNISNREFYTKVFPVLLDTIIRSGKLSKYYLFSNIKITGNFDRTAFEQRNKKKDSLENTEESYKISIPGMGGLQSYASDAYTEQWADAYNSDEIITFTNRNGTETKISVKEIAESLFYYNFYTLGYNFHPTVFMNLVPAILKQGLRITTADREIGYIDFIRNLISGNNTAREEVDLVSFIKQYILNHLDNKKLVFNVKGPAKEFLMEKKNVFSKEDGWAEEFHISYGEMEKSTRSLFLVKDKTIRGELIAFRPVIALEKNGTTVYYMADNRDGVKFNVTNAANGVMRYKQVFPQGAKGQSIQYFSNGAYNSYQTEGNLNKFNRERLNKKLEEQENDPTDGAPENVADGTHVEDVPFNNFSEAEWTELFTRFNEKHPDQYSSVEEIKDVLSKNENTSIAEELKRIAKEIENPENRKTIDGKGNVTVACK